MERKAVQALIIIQVDVDLQLDGMTALHKSYGCLVEEVSTTVVSQMVCLYFCSISTQKSQKSENRSFK